MSIDAARIILRNFPFVDVVQDNSQQASASIFATEHSKSLSDNITVIDPSFIGLPFSPYPNNETIDVEFIKTDGTLSTVKCPCLNISENSEDNLVSFERYKFWRDLKMEGAENEEILALLISKKVNGLVYAIKILFLSERKTLSQIKNSRTNFIDTKKNRDFGTKNSLLPSIYNY